MFEIPKPSGRFSRGLCSWNMACELFMREIYSQRGGFSLGNSDCCWDFGGDWSGFRGDVFEEKEGWGKGRRN